MHLSLGPPKTPIAVAAAPTTTEEWDQSLSEVIYFCRISRPIIESLEIILTIVPALIVNLNFS